MQRRWSLWLVCLALTGCVTTSPPGSTPGDEPPPTTAEVLSPQPPIAVSPIDPVPLIDNAWERALARFELEGCDEHQVSRDWARWYGSRPDYMARTMARAEPWIYDIVGEIERRGLPGELALLPIVESAYDPFAYSHGNASGMWQFIATTGRRFGLEQNWWYDGRRDVWMSTRAALDYLEYLHGLFDDWLLALAAYNTGEGRVARRIASNERRGRPTDFWHLSLPRETRGYVPKMMGLVCLFRDPARYGWELPHAPNHATVARVELRGQADLVLISQLSGVPIVDLYHLNPGLNHWATSPTGPNHVMLPIEAANRVGPRLQQLEPSALMKWDVVEVRRGDTLSALSQRHQVPVSVIRTANDLSGDLIRVGQELRLPRGEGPVADPAYVAAAAELASLQSGLVSTDRVRHRVRPGESLSVIASRYGVSSRDLARWNNIANPNRLRAGQTLVIFRRGPAAPAASSKTLVHTVRSGDSLWSISRKYDVALKDLMRWNGLNSRSRIHPGQSIKVSF